MLASLRALFSRLLYFRRRAETKASLDDELAFHVEMETAENLRAGMPPEEARRRALVALGGVEQIKQDAGDARSFAFLADLARDLRFGTRQLLRSPGFALMAVLTLALGIAASTAVFSLVDATLLARLPYRDAQRIVALHTVSPRSPFQVFWSQQYLALKQSVRTCEQMAVFDERGATLRLGEPGFPQRISVATVTPDFFRLLGIPAAIGRTFSASDAEASFDVANSIVLSYRLFESRFNSNPGIVGDSVRLSDRLVTVVGVMPPEFQLPQTADAWVPTPDRLGSGCVICRMAAGASLRRVESEADARLQAFEEHLPASYFRYHPRAIGVSLREHVVGKVWVSVRILLGVVVLALLIACVNVTNLLLLRNQKRRHELSIRAALGASSARLARQTLAESSLLASAGGLLGIVGAAWMMRLLPRLAPAALLPGGISASFNWRVLLFASAATIMTSLLIGLLPALRQPWSELNESIRQAGGQEATSKARLVHGALVAAQIALTLILLCGAGLMVRSFIILRKVVPDIRDANVYKFEINLSSKNQREQAGSQASYPAQFFGRLADRVRELPGVKRVVLAARLPGSDRTGVNSYEGWPKDVVASYNDVSPGYFEMLGIPLISGRTFTDDDNRPDAPRNAVINHTLARMLFGDENPVGRKLAAGKGSPTVIGVVADVREFSVFPSSYPVLYRPAGQISKGTSGTTVLVETSQDLGPLISAVRRLTAELDPEVPVFGAMAMQEYVGAMLARDRFSVLLMSFFALMTLLLAAIGVYGVIAQSVEQRLREMAVRLALGARPEQVMRLVLLRGAAYIAAGLATGLCGALVLTRVLASLLYEVKPGDAGVFATVLAVLTGVAFLACYGPARRATQADPLTILRAE